MILEDGFSTIFTFALNGAIKIAEKEVTPPGIDGGDAIDVTTMRNTAWRTRAFRSLKTLTEAGALVAYDPATYPEMVAMINENQQITVTFPDAQTLTFWGALRTFIPQANKEGEQPTAQCAIEPSNRDNSGVEQAPVLA